MTAPSLKRRFPKVLADELSFALHLWRQFGDEGMELLARYRRNKMRMIASTPLRHPWLPRAEELSQQPIAYEYIPPELNEKLRIIDSAFAKLYRYREPGGADEYVAVAVGREVNRQIASRPRGQRVQTEEIRTYVLKTRNYAKSNIKKQIIQEAAQYFGVSERTIYRAIR